MTPFTSTFTYTAANLALDTETITYNLPGQPAFTRVLDRSRDTLGRDTGYTLGTPSPSLAVETQAEYQYSATTGRLATVIGGGTSRPLKPSPIHISPTLPSSKP